MSFRYLLDTNVLSEPIKSRPNPRIVAAIEAHEGELATASIVWHELVFGVERLADSDKRRALSAYLESAVRPVIPILPYDEAAASWHARERGRLARAGRPPGAADGQIAAIARTNDLVLVTANARDFKRFSGLAIEDWSR